MRTALTAVKNGRRFRLYGNHLHVGVLLLQVLACTTDGTTGTHTTDKDVHLPIGIAPNLRTCGSIVLGGVGSVFKLLQDNCTGYAVTQLLGSADGTRHTVFSRGEANLSTVGFYQVTALHAHGLGHGKDKVVALNGADQCQSYASISAGGFNDGGSRLQDAFLLSILNHRQCDTVLYAAARIKKLYFGNYGSLQSLSR